MQGKGAAAAAATRASKQRVTMRSIRGEGSERRGENSREREGARARARDEREQSGVGGDEERRRESEPEGKGRANPLSKPHPRFLPAASLLLDGDPLLLPACCCCFLAAHHARHSLSVVASRPAYAAGRLHHDLCDGRNGKVQGESFVRLFLYAPCPDSLIPKPPCFTLQWNSRPLPPSFSLLISSSPSSSLAAPPPPGTQPRSLALSVARALS